MQEFPITNPSPAYLRGLRIVYPVLKKFHEHGLLKVTQEPMVGRISHEPGGAYIFQTAIGHVLRTELNYLGKRFVSNDVRSIVYTVPCAGLNMICGDEYLNESSVRPEWVVSFLLEEVVK